MKDRISEMLSTGGFYTLDLYRKVDANISFQAFQLILNAGLASGDWECTDGYWRLPKQTEIPQQVSPLDIEVDYLLNTARCFTDPSEKDRLKLNSEKYFEHQNYHPKTATLRTMFDDNLAGYQIVPGNLYAMMTALSSVKPVGNRNRCSW